MKVCEGCGCRTATIHLMQINGAEQKSLFLCEECAKNQGITVSVGDGFLGTPALAENSKLEKTDGECPACGMELSDFSRTGRVGCPECYIAFAPQIEALHRELHGSTNHCGKKYRSATLEKTGKCDLINLKVELAAAIKNEEFERAALLRDAIHDLHRTERE